MPPNTIEDYRAEIQDLKERISELEEENEFLQSQLDEIAKIFSPEEYEDSDED